MIRTEPPITAKALQDARTQALLTPPRLTTRVIYINVGNLPPIKAADLFERVVAAYKEKLDGFNYENVFIAIREGESRVEVFDRPVAPAPRSRPGWMNWRLRLPRAS